MGYMGQNVSAGDLRDMIGIALAVIAEASQWMVNVYLLYCLRKSLQQALSLCEG